MRILLLNWSEGENDPFSYFNRQFQRQLQDLGHEVHIVPLNDLLYPTLEAIQGVAPIDLVFTWQGIGSALGDPATGRTFWEMLDIPLVCLHGDHPCYNPVNHQQLSRHVLHVYLVQTFARDADRIIPRQWPALFDVLPNFIAQPEHQLTFEGEHFVFPKNFTDQNDTRSSWRQRCDDATYRLLCECADAIEQEYRRGSRRDHHDVILDHLPVAISEPMKAGRANKATIDLVVRAWRELDHVYRNVSSAFVLDTLTDVPIHVYGRGWERFAARGNPRHVFKPAGNVGENDAQFGSAWGIIDIAPINQSLHDRTLRALRHGAGFLLSSVWRQGEPIHDGFTDLFFSGSPDDLTSKAALVQRDPEAHRARARQFSEVLDAVFTMADFVSRIRGYAEQRDFRLSA